MELNDGGELIVPVITYLWYFYEEVKDDHEDFKDALYRLAIIATRFQIAYITSQQNDESIDPWSKFAGIISHAAKSDQQVQAIIDQINLSPESFTVLVPCLKWNKAIILPRETFISDEDKLEYEFVKLLGRDASGDKVDYSEVIANLAEYTNESLGDEYTKFIEKIKK